MGGRSRGAEDGQFGMLLRALAMAAFVGLAYSAGSVQAATDASQPAIPAASISHTFAPITASRASVRRADVPQPPLITTVSGVGLGILVNWEPAAAGDNVTGYTVTATPDPSQSVTVPSSCSAQTATGASADTMAVVQGVCAHVAYLVSITATNSSGPSPSSATSHAVVPLQATAPDVPIINSVLGRAHALLVTWSAPTYNGGEAITKYVLTARSGSVSKTVTTGPNAGSTTLPGLRNGSNYTVSLVAVNAAGQSPAATMNGTPQAPGVPGTPTELSVTPASTSAIHVSWFAPLNNGGSPITGYKVSYLKEVAYKTTGGKTAYKPALGSAWVTKKTASTSLTVSGLSGTQVFYVFKVAAVNSKGTSAFTPLSQPITLQTRLQASARLLTPAVLGQLVSDDAGTLSWQYPSDAQTPSAVSSLTAGQTLVGGVSTATPDGILVTVTSVSHPSSGAYIVTTTPAALSDAFRTLTLQAGSATAPSSTTGASLRPKFVASMPGVRVRSNDAYLPTLSLSLDTSLQRGPDDHNVSVSLLGELDLTPSVDLEVSLLQDPSRAAATFTAGLDTNISVTASVSGAASWKRQIADYQRPVFFLVSGFPVYMVFKLPVYLEASVTGQVSVTTSVGYYFGEQASWTSADPDKLSLADVSHQPGVNAPDMKLAVQATFTPGIEADPQLELYGFTGPELDVTLAPTVTVTPTAKAPDPWLEVDLGLTVGAYWNVNLPPFVEGKKVGTSYTHTWKDIYKRVGSPPTLPHPLNVSPSSTTLDPGGQQQFSVSGASGALTWTLSGNTGDTISSSGLLKAAQPSGRTVTVDAKDASGDTGTAVVSVGALISPPQNVSAKPDSDGTGATVSWAAPSEGAPVSYTITTSPKTATSTVGGGAVSAHIVGLTPGTTYTVSVVAVDGSGNESAAGTAQLITSGSSGGSWVSAEEVPGIASLDEGMRARINSLSCGSAGNCSAGGWYDDHVGPERAFLVDETNGTWGNAEEVPGIAALDPGAGTEIVAEINSVSCASAGNCSAGGFYDDSSGGSHAFVVNEANGVWGNAEEVPGTVASGTGINSISCASADNCSAAGYTDGPPFVVDETNGVWGNAEEVTGTPLNQGGTASTISCASAGNCSAGGFYDDSSRGRHAFVVNEANGVWGNAEEVTGTPLNQFAEASIESISCPSTGNCSAGGTYVDDSGGNGEGFVVDETDGTWREAEEVPLKRQGGAAAITFISCASAGNCSAAGYTDIGFGPPFVVNETNGIWGNAEEVPELADTVAFIEAISCARAGNCSAGGLYDDSAGYQQAFVVDETNGVWGDAEEVAGTAVLNQGGDASIQSISCAPKGSCSAGGVYDSISGPGQPFVVSRTAGG